MDELRCVDVQSWMREIVEPDKLTLPTPTLAAHIAGCPLVGGHSRFLRPGQLICPPWLDLSLADNARRRMRCLPYRAGSRRSERCRNPNISARLVASVDMLETVWKPIVLRVHTSRLSSPKPG